MVAVSVLLVTVGATLALFVYQATTQISEALAEEVLQQQRDVAALLYKFSDVSLAIEQQRLNAGADTRTRLAGVLNVALQQLKKMRSEYSFARLDGAAKAHAYVKPVLEDIEQWSQQGVPGYAATDAIVLAMMARRVTDRNSGLRLIATETDSVARSLIFQQTRDLDKFRDTLMMLLGAFALLAVAIVALLTRQRNLQFQLAADQEQQSHALIEAETRGRQRAELALLGSEKLLGETLNALPSSIVMLNQSGHIVAANTPWKIFVDDRNSPYANGGIGESFLSVYESASQLDAKGAKHVSESIKKVLSGAQTRVKDEFVFKEADNRHWVAISATTFDNNGEQHTVLVHEDVSERKHLEERDRRLRAELAHVSRLSTAGEMASGLAHELNQPLTAISHNCHSALVSVREAEPDDSELIDTINDIYEQTQRAGGIIRSMRQLVRHDSGDFRSTNLNTLVQETVRLTQPEAREQGVEVQIQLAKDLPEVRMNPVQIQQVLVNLERNSVEAMGSKDCTVRSLRISTAHYSGSSVQVSVHDTGPGVDKIINGKLFTAFQTTKSDGMGLGLSISRSIVEAHGGKLWVDPSITVGTTFHFTLLCEPESAKHETA